MERRSAVILVADVVVYSSLIGVDEERTHTAFHICRRAIEGLVERHGGRIFGTAGDGLMVEFASPSRRSGLQSKQSLLCTISPMTLSIQALIGCSKQAIGTRKQVPTQRQSPHECGEVTNPACMEMCHEILFTLFCPPRQQPDHRF